MFTTIDIAAVAVMLLFVGGLFFTAISRFRHIVIIGSIGSIAGLIAVIYAALAYPSPQWVIILAGMTVILSSLFKMKLDYQQAPQFDFSDNEIRLHHAFFPDLNPTFYMKLIELAIWREVEGGQTLLTKGQKVPRLSLVFSGTAQVNIGNDKFVKICEGQFIGEMSYISGHMASGTVTTVEKTILVEWPQEELKVLVSQNTVIGNCIQSHFNRDLIKKLG
ncbi:MAG: hypothetical protein ACI8WB_001779 [Phenylobacterium sp.]|jgi:hypothetical protein